MRNPNWHFCFLLLICLAASACQMVNRKLPCGCESEPIDTVENIQGTLEVDSAGINYAYSKYLNGISAFIIQRLTICNPEVLDSLDINGNKHLPVVFTAQYRKSCKKDLPGTHEERDITITQIRIAQPKNDKHSGNN